ncbi:MAG: PEP-CTERM sorting domain-containing protein [Rubrivivax sp.]|nr:MAG: PEP-CTERM sorting domain-containing protein [Rubrivivax sp.]
MRQLIVASALLAVFSTQVQATSNPVIAKAQLSVTNLDFRVTNTDPSDQNPPEFKLYDGEFAYLGAFKTYGPYHSEIKTTQLASTSFFDSSSSSAALSDPKSSVAMNKQGNGFSASATANAEAFQNLPYREHGGYPGSGVTAYIFNGRSYWELAAHTQLTITGQLSGNYQIDASSLSGLSQIGGETKLEVMANNFAVIELSEHNGIYTPSRFFLDMRGKQLVSPSGVVYSKYPDDTVNQPFSITYRNDTDELMNLDFYLHISSQVDWIRTDAPVPSIPEPETWALVAMGLGMVAWRLRSRQSRRPPL